MAGLKFYATVENIQTGTARKTILQAKTPAQQRGKVLGFGISFAGVTAADPEVRVRVLRQTTDGTFANVVTPVKHDPAYAETIQTVCHSSATAEPTAGDVLFDKLIHPQGGAHYERLPFGDEWPVPGGGRIGIDVLATVDIQCDSWMAVEE